MQKKQLNEQFCNMSPIDQNLSAYTNNFKSHSLSGTISFEKSLCPNNQQERLQEENNEDEVDACSKQSSFILLSPNKIYNEKAGSLIHGLGLLNDDDETTSASSLVESQLNFPFSFNSLQNLKNFKTTNSLKQNSSSSIDNYSESDIKKESKHSLSSFEKTQQSETNTRQSNQNMLTCVTSFLSTSSSSNLESSKKTNSLISFEQHENSSNQTKEKTNNETTQCFNMSSVNDYSSNFTQNNQSLSKLISSVKSKIEKSKLENDQLQKHPIFNSTPLIAMRQNLPRSPLSDEKFQSFLENVDTSSNSVIGELSKDLKHFNRDYLDNLNDDDTECDNLNSNEISDMVSLKNESKNDFFKVIFKSLLK
jgi:hypothetical protein